MKLAAFDLMPRIFRSLIFTSLAWCSAVRLTGATVTVDISSSSFSPSSVAIQVNDQVNWTWQSDFHSTTSTSGLWDSGVFNSGHTYVHTFTTSGTFPYLCTVHGFTGSVTVRQAGAPPVVAITNPGNGAVLVALAAFQLQATASDPDGTISSVQFFRGATAVGIVRTNPYALTVSGLSQGRYVFSAVATDNSGRKATNAIAVLVVASPTITTNPVNRAVQVGGMTTFKVAATAGDLQYRWWWIHPDQSTTTAPSWTNAALTLSNVQPGNAGGYFAVVTNLAGTATSRVATLIVSPTITNQPHSQIVAVGSNALFHVGATGLSVNYHWRHNGVPVVGGTNPTLSIANAQPSKAGNYSVVVANSAGAVTSIVANLTVLTLPTITTNPGNRAVRVGGTATFKVAATGGNLQYRWWWIHSDESTTTLPGWTNAVLTLSSVQPRNAGGYYVVITNLAGTATSRVASLVVSPTITNQPRSQIVAAGSNALFEVGATGLSVNYHWRHNGVPVTGGTNATLAIVNVQAANAGNYSVVVANPAGAVTSIVATLSVAVTPAIVLRPRSQTVAQGSNVTLALPSLAQPLRLTAFGGTAGAPYTIRFFGVSGSNYVLETSTDLTNWVVLKTAVTTNGVLDYVDGDSSNTAQRFFRVR